MKSLKFLALTALASSLQFPLAVPAMAGVFSVTPVRIFMAPKDRGVAITLTNEGDTEIALQADINGWAQKPDGTDELVLTDEMVLSPPSLKLAPKARQVVRLALLRPIDPSRQLTYRLVIREVPEATTPNASAMEVPVALALSMPVFITPPSAKAQIDCKVLRGSANEINAACGNTGTAYGQIREITVKRGEQNLARFEGGSYILPGAGKVIPLKADKSIAAGAAELNVVFDDGKNQAANITVP
jgi:fimbrial chaperone protein